MGTKSASPWILYFLVTIPIRNTFVIFMNQLPVNINGFIILTHNRLLGGGEKGVLWEPVGHVMNLRQGTERIKLTGEPNQVR